MKEIIIKESQWGRGNPGMGQLRNKHTKRKCCLGFVCSQLGFKGITGMGMPNGMEKLIPGLTEDRGYYIVDTDFSEEAAKFNDDDKITDEERKFWLKILAKDAGFKFVFVP